MKYILLCCLCIGLAQGSKAQQTGTIIRGKVVSETDQSALEGATVRVKDTDNGARTDKEGRFELTVPENSVTLVVSFVGYQSREVDANTKTGDKALLVELSPESSLLEKVVVSTGYQLIPQERATGSFEHISNELLNRQISTDVISRLDGIAESALFTQPTDGTITGSPVFKIRGLSTISSQIAQPLIILDNFPYEGDITNINPNDVESITLLKDAAAASIWGARAGNGVLVITTKKGRLNEPFQLSVTSNVGIIAKPDLFYQPQMTPSDFINIEKFLFEEGAYDALLSDSRYYPAVTPVVEILNRERAGEVSAEEASRQIDVLRSQDIRDQLDRYFYREAVNQQYAVMLNGGSTNLGYRMSLGYDKNLQSLVGNEYERFTFRAQNTFRPTRHLKLDMGVLYTLSSSQNNNPGRYSLDPAYMDLYPYARLADEQGGPLALEKEFRLGFLDTAGGGRLFDWHYRPLEEIRLTDNVNRNEELLLNLTAKYNLTPALSAGIQYQYGREVGEYRRYYSEQTYFARDMINRFTHIEGETVAHAVPIGGILDLTANRRVSHAVRGQLNFNENWKGIHRLAAIIGGELRDNRRRGNSGRTYGYDDELLIYQAADLVNRYPTYRGIAGTIPIYDNRSFYSRLDRFVSLYANASYIFDGRYVLSGSVRRDASNLFGVETNQKWKPFWSAGMAWNISDEHFYDWDLFSYLKLRATYGYSGNVNNTIAAVTTIEYRNLSPLSRLPFAFVNNPPNPSLRWEKVSTSNVGLDFGISKNRLSGSVEYYFKRATDLISSVPADMTSGFDNLTLNSSILHTYGVDFSIKSANVRGVFSWQSDFWFSYNKNKIVKHLFEFSRPNSYISKGNNLIPVEGEHAYNVVSYRWGGLDPNTGDPMGYVNGELSKDYSALTRGATLDDLVFHGTAKPQYFGALRNTFTWKGFSMSTNITYRFAYYFRRNTVNYAALLGGGAVAHGDYYDRWQQPGDDLRTNIPSMIYPASSRRDEFYRDSEVTVERGDHIRLQDIALSYQINNVGQLPVRNIKITAYARNLGILWRANDRGIDPDYLTLPAPPTVSLGLSVDL